jgi:hypothetical protein
MDLPSVIKIDKIQDQSGSTYVLDSQSALILATSI